MALRFPASLGGAGPLGRDATHQDPPSLGFSTQKSPDTPGSPEGNTEGPGTASLPPRKAPGHGSGGVLGDGVVPVVIFGGFW